VILLDVDHFKAVNDEYGHPVGDELLRLVGEAIRREAGSAIACRYGGEEFALICPALAEPQLRQAAERVRRAVAALELDTPRGPVRRTASLGGCWVARATAGLSARELVVAADAELYRAKRAGRDRCCVTALK
jgi:diguanylate cyclase (GGDEF)-like protein